MNFTLSQYKDHWLSVSDEFIPWSFIAPTKEEVMQASRDHVEIMTGRPYFHTTIMFLSDAGSDGVAE